MRNCLYLYIFELVVTIIAILIGFAIYEVKYKKGFLKYLGIVLGIFIVVFGISFTLETPDIYSEDVIILQVKENSGIKKPNAMYHFVNVTDKIKIKGNVDYNKIGEYTIEYEIDTLRGKYTKESKIIIQDTKAPEITLIGDKEINQSYSKEFEELGYSALDNYDGDLTDKVETSKKEIDENNYVIVYTVKDSSGNNSEEERKVILIDDIPPEITLNGKSDMVVYIGNKYEEKGATAKDEKDGDLTEKISIEGDVDTSKEGKYTIKYKVSDNSSNESVKTRTVTVKQEVVAKPTVKQSNTNSSGGNKVIYLTFDDGPSSYTSQLLDTLKAYNVKATFFVTNSGSDSIIKREYDEGHTVALHTNSHNYSYIYKNSDNFFNDLYAVQSRVERITGHKSYIMRFPGGSSNKISKQYDGGQKIMSYLTKEVVNRGFRYYDWNVSSGDAGSTTSSDGVYNNVIKSLKSGASVVLQHDIKKFSVDAVPRIIEYGLQNGYTFKKITENTPMVTHGVNN